jgi:hypothetical protein
LRLAKKQGVKVDRGLKDQIDRFGKGRQETFKRNPIRLKSVSRHPIRLRSVAKAKATPSSIAKAKPRPKAKAKAKARTLARDRARGPAEVGLKVHGRALKLGEKIRNLANKWAANHQLSAYFLESPFQVRHLAARQLQQDTGAKGTVAAAIVQRLWAQDEACSSCDDRKRKLEPGVAEYLRKKAEAEKAKADHAVKSSAAAAWRAAASGCFVRRELKGSATAVNW